MKMQDVLASFAAHTRQSEEERQDVAGLLKKYVAVHIAGPVVYSHIASDYNVLSLRTHTPPLQSYGMQPIDTATFLNCMKHVDPSPETARHMHAFGHFCDTLFPVPVGQEAWIEYERKEEGQKKRAYFIALNFKDRPNFYNIVNSIAGGGESKPTVDRIYSQLCKYNVPKHLVPHVAEEIGTMLSTVSLPEKMEPIECAEHGKRETEEEAEEREERPHVEARQIEFVNSSISVQVSAEHPLIDDYRRKVVLPPTFPRSKLVKQMILSSINVLADERIMAANQRAFATVDATVAWPMLMSSIAGDKATFDTAKPWVRDFALNVMKTDKPDTSTFLKAVLSLYVPGQTRTREEQKYLTKHPKIDESLIKQVVLL